MKLQENDSNKTCTAKAIIVLILFLIFGIAALIVIIILVKKTGNYYDSYIIGDLIIEKDENDKDNEVHYYKINTNIERYIFDLSDNVKRIHVKYENRYGIELAADLYTPKNLDQSKKYPGIVIGPPYGGVKEQGPGVYANQLAQKDFICLAFDPSFNGESGGKKRKVSSSDIFVEDFSAGVDYLGTLQYVDRNKIGGIGICGSGSFLIGAAAIDIRFKAIVTSAMYDISDFLISNLKDWDTARNNLIDKRWADVDNGYQECIPAYASDRVYVNDTLPTNPVGDNFTEFKKFYTTLRGHHPRATGAFTTTSDFSILNFNATANIAKIKPRPILFITGSKAHSKKFSENALKASENNENQLHIVPEALHIDLYDNITLIPFVKIIEFFKDNLV